jgi:hypothetical protein
MKPRLLVLITAATLLYGQAALGFCRATTCDPAKPKQHCNVNAKTQCVLSGEPLFWASDCITVNVQRDAAPLSHISLEAAEASVSRALDTWLSADCGSGRPSLRVTLGEPVACDTPEYTDKRNANVILFREHEWPYEGGEDALGVTWLTYDIDNEPGALWDADIELNAVAEPLSVGTPKANQVDLDSLITHEMGHLLGLAHTLESGATMKAGYDLGSIELRSLEDDDVAGICEIYPPGRPSSSTSCEPRHGFSELCSSDQPAANDESQPAPRKSASSCGFHAPGELHAWAWLVALGSIAARRRRRAR